jgi:hypothetical protein
MTKEQITAMLATRKDAHHLVQKRLVLDGILMTQFDATPPPETLVYSCVTHWIQEVPF